MESRRWVLIAGGIFLLILLTMLGLRFVGAPRIFNSVVLYQLRPVLGEKADLASIDIRLGGIILNGLQYIDDEAGVEIYVKTVRINWNLFNSVIYGLKPLLMIDEILIDEWKVGYVFISGSRAESRNILESIPWDLNENFPSIKKITLKDGQVETDFMTSEHINFWLDLDNPDTLIFDFSAAVMSDSVNLRCNGMLEPEQKVILVFFELKNAVLEKVQSQNDDFQFLNGWLNIHTQATIEDTLFSLAGNIQLSDVYLEYQNTFAIDDAGLKIDLFPDSVEITGQGLFDERPFSLTGSLFGYIRPVTNLAFDADNIDLSTLLEKSGIDTDISGSVNVSAGITGSLLSPMVNFKLNSTVIHYGDVNFDYVSMNCEYSNEEISLKSFDCSVLGGELKGRGKFTSLKSDPQADLVVDYRGKPVLGTISEYLRELPVDLVELSAQITGGIDKPEVYVSYTLKPSVEIGDLKGTAQYRDRSLMIDEGSGAGDNLNLEIRFDESSPLFSLSGRNIQELFPEGFLPDYIDDPDFSLDVFAGGGEDKFDVFMGVKRSDFTVNFNTEIQRNDSVRIAGDYVVILQDSIEAGGDISLSLLDSMLTIQNLTAGSDLYLTGKIDIKNQTIHDLSLKAEEWGVDTLLLYLGLDNWEDYQGLLKLDVSAEGSFAEPDIEFSAYLSDGRIFDTEGYWTSIAGEFKGNRLRLIGLDMGNRGSLLFSGRGQYDIANNEIDFRASLDKVDFGLLFDSFTTNKGKFNGFGTYTIQAGGTVEDPLVETGFRIENGRLFGVEFDQFTGGFKFDGGIGDKGAIEIPPVQMIKNGKYNISAEGLVPLNGEELKLNFIADGNLLAVASGLTRSISQAASEGRVEISLGGMVNKPVIENAYAAIENGSIKLTSVVDEIENINFNAVLEEDFIDVRNLSGAIEGVPFTLHNSRSMVTADGPLEPWIIGSTGLNIGILTLETGKEGLKLNIPGIVADGETANLSVTGLVPGEKSYIAGPEAHPVIRTQLIVRDGVISYPRPKKTRNPKKKKSIIIRLLEKADWDMEIISDRGNSYIRDMSGLAGGQFVKDISGLFSRAEVDLDIERRLEGLKLDGSIKGDTSFAITGGFISSRGTVNVLDLDFAVQEFKIEFDPAENIPWIEGYATNEQRNTDGVEQTIVLRVANVDPITGEKVYRARWGDFTFILENDIGDSQEQILGVLGYSPETLTDRATTVPLKAVDSAIGVWLGRLEREIKNVLGVDYINIDPALAQNLLSDQLTDPTAADTTVIDWRTKYLRHSRFTVGKYITDDLFFTYSGRFESGESLLDQREKLGMIHTWNLEFRLPATAANLLMIMAYEYDNLESKTDARVSIRYTFNF